MGPDQDPRASLFGSRLRMLRLRRRLSIRRTAALARVTPSYLSRIERGRLPPPSREMTARLARVLQTDPEALIALTGRIPTDILGAFRRRSRVMVDLVRSAELYSDDQIERLCRALGSKTLLS